MALKRLLSLPLLVVVALAVSGILEPSAAQRRRANKVKLGTIAPKNSVYHAVLMRMRQSWREISGGAVDLTVYPGGVAGDEVTMLRKMRVGQMQGALISGSGMSFLDQGVNALQVPLMFESLEEFDFVRDRLAPVLERRLSEKGFTVLGWGDAGWAHFFSVREFRAPDELRRMKMFTSKGDDEMLKLYSQFGFRAVPLDLTELQANLETGLVEAFAVPPLVAAGYQWFASAPNMLNLRFAPIVGAVLIANETWDAIPERQQVLMREAAAEAAREIEEAVRRQEDEAVSEMRKYGLRVIEADETVVAEWNREVEATYPDLRDRFVPGDLMDEALRLRDEFRAQ